MGPHDATEEQPDTARVELMESGITMAPRTERCFFPWRWQSSFLVYLLLALAYLLITILIGLVVSKALKLSSEVSMLHKQVNQTHTMFPCGPRTREWEYFDGRCYYFSFKTSTWQRAKALCEARNSGLVIIGDLAEQNFIASRTRNDRFWIGLTDVNVEGQWRWIDGTDYVTGFKNWKKGEPNDAGSREDCAQVDTAGEWNDVPCDVLAFYMCEKLLPS
ncbi:hepatic lectin-like [Tiliqua scincoides]|uniref:hepatic lectin-like n=1 Tax=Tiliqua scincoides TaxID=71010 RepID=UPI0034635038